MPESYKDIETRISEAYNAYFDREKPKIKPLSREFDVPYERLLARIKGRNSRSTRKVTNKALDEAQEQAIIQWVTSLDKTLATPTPSMIEQYANQLLSRSGVDRTVGKTWVYRFIKRLLPHLNLEPKKQKPNESRRIQTEPLNAVLPDVPELEIFGDTPPQLSSSITNLPPASAEKLRRSISKAKKALDELADELDKISPHLNRRLEHIFQGSLIQAELNVQRGDDIDQILRNREHLKAKKTRRRVKK